MSEVRRSGREGQTAMAQEWLRGANPHPRPGVVAERSHPVPKARGGCPEEQPHVMVRWLRGHRRA